MEPIYRLRLTDAESGDLLVSTDHLIPEHAGRQLARYPGGEFPETGFDLVHLEGDDDALTERPVDALELDRLLSGVDAQWQDEDRERRVRQRITERGAQLRCELRRRFGIPDNWREN